jgi:hypothetical protein
MLSSKGINGWLDYIVESGARQTEFNPLWLNFELSNICPFRMVCYRNIAQIQHSYLAHM